MVKMIFPIFLTALIVVIPYSNADYKNYHGYQVFSVQPHSEKEVKNLLELQENSTDFSFWKEVTGIGQSVHIMVPPELISKFTELTTYFKFDTTLWIEDVQERIDGTLTRSQVSRDFGWNQYHRLQQVSSMANLI